jgi:gliding motility-associated-like protein
MKHLFILVCLVFGTYFNPLFANIENPKTQAVLFSPAPPCPGMTVIASSDSVRCFGESNGVARVSVSGTGTISYQWNDPSNQNTEAATGLAAGTYNVLITDGLGCSDVVSVTVEQPIAVTIIPTIVNVSCNGQSNASVTLNVFGGTAGYYYSWSTGASTKDVSGLSAGAYSIIVSDKKGCVAVKSIQVTQPQPLVLTKTVNNVACKGAANGSITLGVSGGTGPYNYSWSHGPTTKDVSLLAVGGYTVTVTDSKGCTANTSASITEPLNALALNTTIVHPTCYNVNNGRVDLLISGGTGPFNYNWSNGFTGEDPASLVAGSYTVIVTDKNACTASTVANLISPSQIVLTTNSYDVSACGLSDGAVKVNVSGGTGGYIYLWSDQSNQTTDSAQSLSAGSYSVLVKDANNCAASASATVNFLGGLVVDTLITHVSCFAGNNGSIALTPSGGTGPYSYAWSNSQSTSSVTNLGAATYAVTVSDFVGCTYFLSAKVNQPQELLLDLMTSNPKCNNTADGRIAMDIIGGTSPFTVLWSNSSDSTIIDSLDIGTYNVNVTDANGCSNSASANLSQPPVLSVTLFKQNVKCYNGGDGLIESFVSGGNSPYDFLWSNGKLSSKIDSLTAGNYSLTVRDSMGCDTSMLVSISQPTIVQINVTPIHLSCYGTGNGAASLSVSGGVSPYTYLWSNNNQSKDQVGLSGGFYTAIVTDNNKCVDSVNVAISEPDSIGLDLSTTIANCGQSDGTATVVANGGTPGYTYLWSPTDQTSATAIALSSGIYNIMVKDLNNCIKNASVIINNPSGPTLELLAHPLKCYGSNDGKINIDLSGTDGPFSYYVVYNNDTIESKSSVEAGNYFLDKDSLLIGQYWVIVLDTNGCKSMKNVVVEQPAALAAIGSTQNITCFGGSNGSISVAPTGGTSPYSYLWEDGTSLTSIQNLVKGDYSVLILDSNNCSITKQFVLVETNSQINISTKNNVKSTCPDTFDGSVEVAISGGTAPYQSIWSNNVIGTQLSNVKPGTYNVLVTDSKLCTRTKSITIEATDNCGKVDLAEITSAFTPNGDGINETWVIKNMDKCSTCKVEVFNRWGNLIFSSGGYSIPWDGTYNGHFVANGTYYYIIQPGEDLDPVSGTVTVIR